MTRTPLRCRRTPPLRITYALPGFNGETIRMTVSIPTGTGESWNWFGEGVLGVLLQTKRAHEDKLRGRCPIPPPGFDEYP